jgi:hypothetical protein
MGPPKSYDPLTVEFIASLCKNLPPILAETMHGWINSPQSLKSALGRALNVPPDMIPVDRPQRQ